MLPFGVLVHFSPTIRDTVMMCGTYHHGKMVVRIPASAQSEKVFAVRMKKPWVRSYPLSTQRFVGFVMRRLNHVIFLHLGPYLRKYKGYTNDAWRILSAVDSLPSLSSPQPYLVFRHAFIHPHHNPTLSQP